MNRSAGQKMSNTGIRKVKVLQGMAKVLAEKQGLNPDDLVILTVSIERVVGDPVSFLLSEIENNENVLAHCYKCEVDMVRIEDRNGEPAFQCLKCSDVAQFDFSILNQSSEAEVNQKC